MKGVYPLPYVPWQQSLNAKKCATWNFSGTKQFSAHASVAGTTKSDQDIDILSVSHNKPATARMNFLLVRNSLMTNQIALIRSALAESKMQMIVRARRSVDTSSLLLKSDR